MSTDKVSTLILEVDLQCEKCYKKIQKVLCKLQPKEHITKIDYDNEKNKVTISGPFDPKKLSEKLRCKACDVIKDIKKPEEKKPEAKKAEEKKPEAKKPEEKKPEVKKPEEKKPEEKKQEEKKPDEKKKPEEKKPSEDKKPKEEAKPTAAAPPPWSSTTTVNLQFMNMCSICYPWPCSDPAAHCHWGAQPQQPQQPQPQAQPQWPSCEGMLPVPGHHHHPSWGAAPKWSPCGGPSSCGGCGSCRGGWPVMPPQQPMCCPGPSACRGCNGCKIVHESKFSYEEYPSNACAIM